MRKLVDVSMLQRKVLLAGSMLLGHETENCVRCWGRARRDGEKAIPTVFLCDAQPDAFRNDIGFPFLIEVPAMRASLERFVKLSGVLSEPAKVFFDRQNLAKAVRVDSDIRRRAHVSPCFVDEVEGERVTLRQVPAPNADEKVWS